MPPRTYSSRSHTAVDEEIAYDSMFDPDTEIHLCACGTAKCRGATNVISPKQQTEQAAVESPWNEAEHKVVKANQGPREKVKKGKRAA